MILYKPAGYTPETVAEEMLTLMMIFQRKLIRPSEQITRESISPMQFQALGVLANMGPQTMSELAMGLVGSKQQLTPIVDKLERMDLVVRTGDPTDRRVIRLELSPRGLEFLIKLKDEFVEMVEKKLSPLESSDRQSLKDALHQVSNLLNKLVEFILANLTN